MTISIEPDRERGGGHVLVRIAYKGPVPADALELGIQKVQTREWLSGGRWNTVPTTIKVPPANIEATPDGLVLRLGKDVVDSLGHRTGLLIELQQLGLSRQLRVPEGVQPSVATHGSDGGIVITGRPRSNGESPLTKRDTVGERPTADNSAATVKPVERPAAPPEPEPVKPSPPRSLEPMPRPPPQVKPGGTPWLSIVAVLVLLVGGAGTTASWINGWWPFAGAVLPPQPSAAVNDTLRKAVQDYDTVRREAGLQ